MLGGVLILGRVTATYVAADKAHTELDPGVASFETVFATLGAGRNVADLVTMSAFFGHDFLLSRFESNSVVLDCQSI